jgi:hypothetical protein
MAFGDENNENFDSWPNHGICEKIFGRNCLCFKGLERANKRKIIERK